MMGRSKIEVRLEKYEMEDDSKAWDIPDYLKQISSENKAIRDDGFGPEDCGPVGPNGLPLNTDAIIRDHGLEPRPLLDWLLLSIIDAHPTKSHPIDRMVRLRRAHQTLTGPVIGRTEEDDYYHLLEIGWRFHLSSFDQGLSGSPELSPIVRKVVDEMGGETIKQRNIEKSSLVRNLERKFEKCPEKWIIAACSVYYDNRHGMYLQFYEQMKKMKELGLPLALDALSIHFPVGQKNVKDKSPPT